MNMSKKLFRELKWLARREGEELVLTTSEARQILDDLGVVWRPDEKAKR